MTEKDNSPCDHMVHAELDMNQSTRGVCFLGLENSGTVHMSSCDNRNVAVTAKNHNSIYVLYKRML